jgi:HSP20 family protein
MSITDLLPWKREENRQLTIRRDDPMLDVFDEMDRFWGDFMRDPFRMSLPGMFNRNLTSFTPRLDMSEGDKEFTVTAEMPGMDENDIQVRFNNGTLSISGEKREENEVKDRRFHRVERSYGSFWREVEIPVAVDEDKITATFKKGVLTVVLPKSTRPEVTGKRVQVLKG